MNLETPVELHQPVIYGGQTALQLLTTSQNLSSQQIEQCFDNGAVWLQSSGKPVRLYDAETLVKQGQTVHLYCNASTLTDCPYTPDLVEDQQQFSIWNKPSGMLSQGSKWGDHWTIQRWIKKHIWPQRDCLITHRLDRFTSGLIIVAHDDAINRQFHRLFEKRAIHKTYRAVVIGDMSSGEDINIETPIDGKSALTRLKVLQSHAELMMSLLEIKPETGRKHQIRRHLAQAGHPVVNDRQYGMQPFSGDLMLQASALEFQHPVTQASLCFELKPENLLSLQKVASC